MNELLEPPRWPNGPPICSEHDRPCFESKEAALDWHKANCPGQAIIRLGRCHATGTWHFVVKARGPSGDSWGGNKREL